MLANTMFAVLITYWQPQHAHISMARGCVNLCLSDCIHNNKVPDTVSCSQLRTHTRTLFSDLLPLYSPTLPSLSLHQLQSTGRLLEEQLPEMMTELLAAVRDKMLCPAESPLTRSLLMEVIELHAHRWSPLEALTTQYYNRTIQKLTTTA